MMTLGEALSVLQQRGYRLVPPEEGTDSWGTTRIANWDAPDHEFDTWPEAVSDALGRPVVARDDAAELRAALDVARDAMVSALVYHHHSLGNPVKKELNAAVNRAGRALAGGESER